MSPLHCLSPGWQLPAHIPVEQTKGHGEPWFTQRPSALHFCGWLPAHRIASGTQSPHWPEPKHALGQMFPESHWPFVPQVCGMRPSQRLAPGEQTPAHVPAEQMKGHCSPLTGLPAASHVCGTGPIHVAEPGTHDPSHRPPLQTKGQTCASTQLAC
jgi:hypothetical protein